MVPCRPAVTVGLAVVSLLFLCISVVRASAETQTGTLGAAFLRVPVGARAMATPDNVTAAPGDASALFSSPAFLATVPKPQVFVTSARWLDDLNLTAASIVLPAPRLGLISAAGVRLLRSGLLQGLDANGNPVTSDRFYDVAVSAALATRPGGLGLDLGATATYVREHLPAENGEAFTVSLGAAIVRPAYRIDCFALDLVGDLAFAGHSYPIERRYGAGYCRRLAGSVTLGTQFVIGSTDHQRLQVGGTYDIAEFLTLRAGYAEVLAGPEETRAPVSAGLGVHYGGLDIDYAYSTQRFFPASHTVSMTLKLGRSSSPAAHRQVRADRPHRAGRLVDRSPRQGSPSRMGGFTQLWPIVYQPTE